MYTTRSPQILSLESTCTEFLILSYCGLVDARTSVSEKDLPVRASRTIRILFGATLPFKMFGMGQKVSSRLA